MNQIAGWHPEYARVAELQPIGTAVERTQAPAEAALGTDFDLREFHDRVLATGTIPLAALRRHIEIWIAARPRR